jgi:hypothetical protein
MTRWSRPNPPLSSTARTAVLASKRLGMFEPHQEIADLEAEIDELADAAERCRKVIVLARVATGAGGLLLVVTLVGLFRSGPTALVLAITAVLGGLALFGSHTSTRDQIMAKIRVREARRAQLIGELELRDVEANKGA